MLDVGHRSSIFGREIPDHVEVLENWAATGNLKKVTLRCFNPIRMVESLNDDHAPRYTEVIPGKELTIWNAFTDKTKALSAIEKCLEINPGWTVYDENTRWNYGGANHQYSEAYEPEKVSILKGEHSHKDEFFARFFVYAKQCLLKFNKAFDAPVFVDGRLCYFKGNQVADPFPLYHHVVSIGISS